MANNYESLKTDGHYTLAYRIFLKIKSWVESKVQTDVPANAEFTDTLPMAYCDTNAGTTAKVAKCTNFSLKNNSFISINFKNGNTVASGTGVTLNINNTGAKPVYVDFDDDSVPTDEPFDAGTYILYYTNQAYYLYTNGVLYPYRDVAKQNDLKYYSFGSQDGSVIITEGSSTSGGATTYTENMSVQKVNGHTVEKDVPSNAVFTDYKSKIKGSCQGLDHTEHIGTVVFNDSDFEVSPGIIDPFGNSSASVTLLHSVGTDVPSNAVFTDEKVKQAPSTANSDFEVLLSGTADNVEHTEEVNKNDGLTFNPSTGNLQTTQLNGVTVGSSPVFTDIKVTQTNTTDSSNYRLLLSGNATDTTQTTTTRKSVKFTANPSTGNLNITQLNGVTVGSSPKFTDTTYTAGDNVNISQQNVISADQIDDSYNYQQYQNLPSSTKMQDKLFIVDDAPDLDPAILNLVYPVGTYYETSDTTFNPNVTWGGTWVLETEGLVHVSSGTNYIVSSNAKDGGSEEITYTPAGTNAGGAVQNHKLTISEMPSHNHSFQMGGTRLDSSGNNALRMQSNVNAGSGNFWVVALARTGSGNYDGGMTGTGGNGNHNHDFTQPTFTGTQATLDNMQPYKIVNRWHRTA